MPGRDHLTPAEDAAGADAAGPAGTPARAVPDGRTGVQGQAPPGWPAQVMPPGIEGWQQSVVEWLLDYGDPAWRLDATLRRHPLVLAQFARHRARAHVAAARAL